MPELSLLFLVVMIITNAWIAFISRANTGVLLAALTNLVLCALMAFGVL